LGAPGAGAEALARTLDVAAVAVAAEAVGGAEAILDLTVAYAKDRHQFGRPIGSFQAIKHRLADVLLATDSADLLVGWAAGVAAGEERSDLPAAAAQAKAAATDAFVQAAATAIQVHGGIGFTWEHDAHLFFKRAKALQLLLGGPADDRERAAQALGLGVAA
jgi:alkylation response protein AidB-like acyl-CoA dehydrogenase